MFWWRKRVTDLEVKPDTAEIDRIRRAADEKRRELEDRARELMDLLTHSIEDKRGDP